MEEEVARQRARDKGQLKGYWAYKPYKANRANRANKANRTNKANEPNRANIKERKKFGFNNTELINLVLIMFPAGSH